MGGVGETRFADRLEAGRVLAGRLGYLAGRDDVVVLGLPRGGVPVAAPVAEALDAPLDVLVVRKLGLPHQPELAMGAIAGIGGEVEIVRNERVLSAARVPADVLADVLELELGELRRRENTYREGRRPVAVRDRVVVVVDDGVATGSTVRAAIAALRHQDPARVVVAAPVGAVDACAALEREADEVVCARRPERFGGVGEWYVDFSPTSDDEVRSVLARGEGGPP